MFQLFDLGVLCARNSTGMKRNGFHDTFHMFRAKMMVQPEHLSLVEENPVSKLRQMKCGWAS
jgi:hypothetical protein